MSFYRACMRHASPILFWVALLVLFATVFVIVGSEWALFGALSQDYGNGGVERVGTLLNALASALANAALPFFGSAAIWLLQQRAPSAEGSPQ